MVRPLALIPMTFMLAFNRMGLREQRMCQVDLPELLDVDQYAGHKPLDSETSSAGTMPKQGI